MIHTTTDFYNKVAKEVRERFFTNENHGTTENKNYWKATQAMEDFNNGVLNYRTFIGRLAKACQSNNATIHNLVEGSSINIEVRDFDSISETYSLLYSFYGENQRFIKH
jgi:hypothetical protein